MGAPYSTRMPDTLSFSEQVYYGMDLFARNVGYTPVLGAAVGIPRIVTGIAQKIIGGDGHTSMHTGDMIIRYQGSKLAADGGANITRGIFETCCLGVFLIPYDMCKEDRWILFPGLRR